MSRYRLAFYFKLQLGFVLGYNEDAIEVHLPFISVLWAVRGYAHGIRFFKD